MLAGLLSACAALGVSEFLAALVGAQSSPLVVIGEAFIDATPGFVEAFAVRTFGTHDKLLLLGGLTLALAAIAALVGLVATSRPRVGVIGLSLMGLMGVAAALTRPGASLADALPSVAGGIAGALTVRSLVRRVRPVGVAQAAGAQPAPVVGTVPATMIPARRASFLRPGSVTRRGFLAGTVLAGGVAAFSGGTGYALLRRQAGSSAAAAASIRIPAPASPAPPIAPGWDLNLPGLTRFLTPASDFYRVDTQLVVPQVSSRTWRLRIHGMVNREITLTYDQLLARPLVERDITLSCVSNEVGGRYASNGRWIGVRLKELLEEAGVKPGADQVVSRSGDGWSAGTPTAVVMDGRDAMLAVALNGRPLPAEHGFPVRMLVPGVYGYANATKWVVDIELTTFATSKAYWAKRDYAQQPPPIKTLSRIDVPAPLSTIKAGTQAIAGVAWAQHRGIQKVEVSVDGGRWQIARLSEMDTVDTWRQFVLPWEATPGEHHLQVRATDGTGATQPEQRVPPLPDGATGWDSVVVTVVA